MKLGWPDWSRFGGRGFLRRPGCRMLGAVVYFVAAALPMLTATPAWPAGKERIVSLHDLTVDSIDLTPQPLSAWKGKVVLVVNTASECGNTPQYAGLQALWDEYKGKGFAVLGFPSNDFGAQEPGREADIKQFCSTRYRVTFPLFAKVKTKGDGQAPVYRFLTAKHGAPRWNFHKYLVGKDGQVIRAFGDKVEPNDPTLRAAIDAALADDGRAASGTTR